MTPVKKGLSITHKFLLFLSFLGIMAFTDSMIFIYQSREIEFYDDLNYRLNNAKFSMIKLEYILDMFVVARHFEQEKLAFITEDVQEVDKSIRELETLGYTKFSDDSLMLESIKYLVEDWDSIKSEFSRLDSEMSYDVILLVHNGIDMNAILFAEKTEKLLADINESRKGVFRNIKVMVMVTLAVSLVLGLFASLVFIFKAARPIRHLATGARKILAGETGVRIREGFSGEAGVLSATLNRMSDTVTEALEEAERREVAAAGEVEGKLSQMVTISSVADSAAESLSLHEIFSAAINGAIVNTGADAGAVYLFDINDTLHIKASSGIDGALLDEIESISPSERILDFDAGTGREIGEVKIKDLDEYPDGRLKAFLKYRQFSSLVTVSINYNKKVLGVLLLEFKDKSVFAPSMGPFLRTLAASLGVITGHINLFYKEHDKTNFYSRLVNQSPLGLAVFDVDGAATMLNLSLKRMLGVSKESDFVRRYKIFEDDIFDREGVLPLIKEAYEGLVNEAELDYDPSRLTWYDFNGQPMKLRLKCFPLYDAGGGVSSIAVLYEDVHTYPAVVRSSTARARESS